MPPKKILLLYPRFPRSHLLNYKFMMPFLPGKRAVMPPLGLLLMGALFQREGFEVRLVDENVHPVTDADFAWADIVGLSGMHQQRTRLTELLETANSLGKITVVGGSSANICPEYYPTANVLHIGEMGDATAELVKFLRTAESRPDTQLRFEVKEKAGLDEQPMPALALVDINAYLMAPLQFSVGCPFTCEFCDIPMIYGRVARMKTPARVIAELDQLLALGFIGSVMFVDDNLIANRKAVRQLLPEIINWQKKHQYPFAMNSEASVNLARDGELLELLREARFTHMFVGVESPDPETLRAISKKQNVMDPVLESLRTIESHGIEVIIGMIFGFDTDTESTRWRSSLARCARRSCTSTGWPRSPRRRSGTAWSPRADLWPPTRTSSSKTSSGASTPMCGSRWTMSRSSECWSRRWPRSTRPSASSSASPGTCGTSTASRSSGVPRRRPGRK
jgi:radical SAM superfamily enzyme YgiQ (UPF0313 family)